MSCFKGHLGGVKLKIEYQPSDITSKFNFKRKLLISKMYDFNTSCIFNQKRQVIVVELKEVIDRSKIQYINH